MVRRWQQLPLDHALSCAPTVRSLLDDLAERAPVTPAHGSPATVPDLGPAVLMDQLTVLVYDVCAAGGAASDDLTTRLADLRRELA